MWYDQLAKDLTESGMKTGIEKSENYVLFLSEGVATRPFVQLELRHALPLEKPIILVHEEDARHGKFEFSEWAESAPEDLKGVLNGIESLPFRRRGYERESMLQVSERMRERVRVKGA